MSPRVSLDHWRALVTVVDCGGYALAAERLHRSQSSVSYAVARLQQQLGIDVLRIEGRKAQLTEAGEALVRRARDLLDEARAIESFARSLAQGWEAEIRLVVDAAFPIDIVLKVLRRFEPLCPDTRVTLTETVLSGTDDALLQGVAELALAPHVPDGFLGEALLTEDFIAVSHPRHALQVLGRELTVADLQPHRQMVIRDSGITRARDSGWLGAKQRWSVSNMQTAIAAVLDGMGYAWLPRNRIHPFLDDGRLKLLPLREGQINTIAMFLIFGNQAAPGPGTQRLAALLREVVTSG
ncbi:MAG: LysR family transcriptional regulator [Gammaproteobacteria bacterium]|nr:LysR family transcriptional regulator [Gammaproteobacteria bacterium]